MGDLDTREWLLTNGLGSFACGTVSDARTRIYHGWLIAALTPPNRRRLLLSHLDASLEVGTKVVALSTNFWGIGIVEPRGYELLQSFESEPIPSWTWGEENWQLSRQLVMPHVSAGGAGEAGGDFYILPTTYTPYPNTRILIQYRYDGCDSAILRLRPIIADRDFHHQQKAQPDLQFSQLIGSNYVFLQAIRTSRVVGTPWQLRWSVGEYQADAVWYWNYHFPEETRRGLSDREDLFSPGYISVALKPGASVTLEAQVGLNISQSPLDATAFEQAIKEQSSFSSFSRGCRGDEETEGAQEAEETQGAESQKTTRHSPLATRHSPLTTDLCTDAIYRVSTTRHSPLATRHSPLTSCLLPVASDLKSKIQNPKSQRQQLLRAGDRFIVYRESTAAHTIIAGYPWLSERGRNTLIALPGLALSTQRFDLAKELLQTLGRHCRYGLIPNAFPDGDGEPFYNSIDTALWWIETLGLYLETTQDWDFLVEQYPTVQQIYKAFITGTKYKIQVDAADQLVSWNAPNVALTWMDAAIEDRPVTPRLGKPVEINALWYSVLCWASDWAERLSQNKGSNSERLCNQARRYTQQAQQVKVSLQKFWNPTIGYLYDTIELDDRPNSQIRPNAVLALSLHHCAFPATQGQQILQLAASVLLTPYGLRSLDPADSQYIGKYAGAPQHRDRAYHQGTVWSWLIGSFIRAWKRFHPSQSVPFDWQPLLYHFQQQACLGSISEIFDGDPPHAPQGAIASSWSVAELIRHWEEIAEGSKDEG